MYFFILILDNCGGLFVQISTVFGETGAQGGVLGGVSPGSARDETG